MAAPLTGALKKLSQQYSGILRVPFLHPTTQQVEITRGRKDRPTSGKPGPNPKYRGWQKQDGIFVFKGELLYKQLGLVVYPGENVGIRKDNTLYALCDGTVMVTCEKLSPFPESPLHNRVKNGVEIHRKFWNIYPTPLHSKYRLVSQN